MNYSCLLLLFVVAVLCCGGRWEQTIEDLRIVYASVDDIDLYVGCLAESARPANGSLMGPTTLCIIGRQFGVTKNNDRFFYDVGQQDGSFTLGKQHQIQVLQGERERERSLSPPSSSLLTLYAWVHITRTHTQANSMRSARGAVWLECCAITTTAKWRRCNHTPSSLTTRGKKQ